MDNTRRILVLDPAAPIPFEVLKPEKYELFITYTCTRQENGEMLCLPARARDLSTGRIIVPLQLEGRVPIPQPPYRQGTFASVDFGPVGIDMRALQTESMNALIERGALHGAEDTPFAQYFCTVPGFAELEYVVIALDWPDHCDFPWLWVKVPLRHKLRDSEDMVHVTTAHCLTYLARGMSKIMSRCQRLYAKEAEEHRCRHRCWGFAQMLEQSGILPQQLFVKALHHAGGRMFVPELHLQLEDGWEPHMFSGPMAYEGKVIS